MAVHVFVAPQIGEDSWLQKPEYETFRLAYDYAATQTQAIRVLAKLAPEDLWHVYDALKRGEEWAALQINPERSRDDSKGTA